MLWIFFLNAFAMLLHEASTLFKIFCFESVFQNLNQLSSHLLSANEFYVILCSNIFVISMVCHYNALIW